MKVAVVVDPYSSGNMLAPAFREAGLMPVAVTSTPEPSEVYAASYRPEDFDAVITHDGDVARTAEVLAGLDPVCVLPGTECGVELADLLAPLVLPERCNTPELAAARRHKGAMQEALVAAGLPTVRQICTDSAEEAEAWIAREGLAGRPLIVKPPKSAGTDGVTLIGPGGDWRRAFSGLLHQRNKLDLVNDQVLVQEYLVGTEHVVDTFSHDGRHTVVDICRYRKRGTVYDSMDWLPYDPVGDAELLDYTSAALDALGVRFGAAHTEVMMTAEGPRLIETGVRLHGGGQPRFCRVATGDSQVDRTVRYCAGGDIPLGYTLGQQMRVVFLLVTRSGVVRNAEILERVADLPSHHFHAVEVRTGDLVRATDDLFASLALGFVVLAHPEPAVLEADYAAIRELERELVIG